MRLWKWLKLGFDQTFSGAWWKQLLWLTSVIVFFFAGMYILRPQVGISPQTENVFTSPAEQETQKLNFWDLVELFIDPGGFANQKEVNRPYALLVVLAGMLLLTGILISVFSNMLERRVERFRKGDSHYAFSNHIIILGIDDMVPYLIQQLRRNAEYKKCDIVVLTVEDTEQVRLKFHAELNRKEERRLVILHGRRDSKEELKKARVHKAEKLFILGEANEYDRDSLNIDCVKRVAEICEQTKRKKPLCCHVLFEYQGTFSVFQVSDISQQIKQYIEFTPFHFYEIWARRVLVKCSAESNGTIHYFPLDRGGISENSENYVHLVIIGMTRMGIALAIEAAHIAHFPNFKTHRKKTRITFIDREARREMDFFMGRYRHLFDLSEARFMDCEQDKTFHPCPRTSTADFIDLEWDFIQGRAESEPVQTLLGQWSGEKDKLLTIAICFNFPHTSLALGLYLPDAVYAHQVPVLIRQETSDTILQIVNSSIKYQALRPFGMVNRCYDLTMEDLYLPKCINYVYDYFYQHTVNPPDLPSEKELTEKWNKLRVVKQWSNIYNASSIATKLRSIGIALPMKDRMRELTPHEIAILAEVEHNRWNVEELLMGYRTVTPEEEKEIEKNIELKNVYKEKRTAHYDIRPYEDLRSDESGRCANVYDISITSAIPLILNHIHTQTDQVED